MAKSDRDRAQGSNAGLDQLLKELPEFLTAQADRLADKASDKLGGLTDQLYDVAENGGKLSDVGGIGARMLQGKSPLKAIAGQSFGKIKDKVTDTASQVVGKGGKGRQSGGGKVVNIFEVADIGLPIRTVYDHWTQYEKFSGFAKGVRDVSRDDETTSDWKLKVGPSSRSWKATVQEQVPDDHIVWTSEGAKGSTRGSVSFHELAPSLTRIVVVCEYHPAGFFEKTGNIWRAQGRRLRLDVKNFVRYATLTTEEPEGWRGRSGTARSSRATKKLWKRKRKSKAAKSPSTRTRRAAEKRKPKKAAKRKPTNTRTTRNTTPTSSPKMRQRRATKKT